MINAPRGTKDILPSQIYSWHWIEDKIKFWCGLYNYEEIRTPIFEYTELFQRGVGDGTDVVNKEMYTFNDRAGRSLSLRPENTAAIVRAYLQNKIYSSEQLVKLFYNGSMFRYDRPQAGRLREFHQFGVEALGEQNPAIDAEIISLAWNFLADTGLKSLNLKLNTVGCQKCRTNYKKKLLDYFYSVNEKLCTDCQERLNKNPLRILDCKVDVNKTFMKNAPTIENNLCDECHEHFEILKKFLRQIDIDFEIDPHLVRGLDYYTKTVFEIQYSLLGAQTAVAGGGRYDDLIKEFGGKETPAVGFAMGIERILLALEMQELIPKQTKKIDAFIVSVDKASDFMAFKLLTKLRQKNFSVSMDFTQKNLKSQMKAAIKSDTNIVLIIGEEEVLTSTVTIKNLRTFTQEKVLYEDVPQKLLTLS